MPWYNQEEYLSHLPVYQKIVEELDVTRIVNQKIEKKEQCQSDGEIEIEED